MADLTEQKESLVGEYKHPPRTRSGGFWFGATLLLLIIGVAGAGFFLLSQLRAKQEGLNGEVRNEMSKQLGGYQTQLSALETHIAALQQDLTNKSEHFDKVVENLSRQHDEKLTNTRKELNEVIAVLQRQLGKTRGDWLIADAEYLLSVANERLYLIGDVNTTKQALEAADQRLRESGDASAFKVRDQVIKDIAALSVIKPLDVVGTYAAIQALQGRIDQLDLLLPYAGKERDANSKQSVVPDSSDSEQSGDFLADAKNKLNELVTIKHSDNHVKEVLTNEEAKILREELRTKLELVKMGLVQQNEQLYVNGLMDAEKWLGQHFSQNSNSSGFLEELKRLKAIKLRSQFPDISLSLKMLRDITKLRVETEAIQPTNTASPMAQPPVNNPGLDSLNTGLSGNTSDDTGQNTTTLPPSLPPPINNAQQLPPPVVPSSSQVVPANPKNTANLPPPVAIEPVAPPSPPVQVVPVPPEPIQQQTSPIEPPSQGGNEISADQQDGKPENSNPLSKFLDKLKQYIPGKH